jgi:hypothetical protein
VKIRFVEEPETIQPERVQVSTNRPANNAIARKNLDSKISEWVFNIGSGLSGILSSICRQSKGLIDLAFAYSPLCPPVFASLSASTSTPPLVSSG